MKGERIAGATRGSRPAGEDAASGSATAPRRPESGAVDGQGAAYEASRVKRERATKRQMEERAEALIEIVDEHKPCTVRQVYYRATVQKLFEKTEANYDKVQRQLVDLRRAGRIPYASITDSTRWQRKPITFDTPTEALKRTAATYRRAIWSELDIYVEVWLEKDALAGVLMPVTSKYDVPLMVSRGYASLSYLHEAARYMSDLGKEVAILHFGDHDPSGQNAADKIEATLREFAPGLEIEFYRCAVTPEQIEEWELPTRPTKTTDSRAKTWTGGDSVELDAIQPNDLRELCEEWIEAFIPDEWLDDLRAAEQSERDFLRYWADALAEPLP